MNQSKSSLIGAADKATWLLACLTVLNFTVILSSETATANGHEQRQNTSPQIAALLRQLQPSLQTGNQARTSQLIHSYQINHNCDQEFYSQVTDVFALNKCFKLEYELISEGLKKFPNNFDLHYRMADYWITVSELDLAEPELKTCLRLSPKSAPAHKLMAKFFNDRLKFDAGLKEAETAIALDPQDPWAWFAKCNSLRNLGRTEEAVATLDQAVKLSHGGDFIFRKLRAELLQRLGRYDASIVDCLYLTKVDPPHANNAYDRIAACYMSMKKPADALKYFDLSLKMNSDNLKSHLGKLAALEALNNRAGAEKERKIVKQLESDYKPIK